jgi:hypothetical protein
MIKVNQVFDLIYAFQPSTEMWALPRQTSSASRVSLNAALYGMTLPSVKLITISTPRDVRTIAPSPRAHAFVTVYDGTFASGKITITATFANGTRVTQSQPAGL